MNESNASSNVCKLSIMIALLIFFATLTISRVSLGDIATFQSVRNVSFSPRIYENKENVTSDHVPNLSQNKEDRSENVTEVNALRASQYLVESNKITNYLIIRPISGLCNQLFNVAHGMMIAYLTNRTLIIDGFHIDYQRLDNPHSSDPRLNLSITRVFAGDVYDCNYLQNFVSISMGINPFPIHCNWNDWSHENNVTGEFKILDHQNRYNGNEVVKILLSSEYQSIAFVNIGLTFGMFVHWYQDYLSILLKNIKFAPLFYDVARERFDRLFVRRKLAPSTVESPFDRKAIDIVGLHLRLEDDMIHHIHRELNHNLKEMKLEYFQMINKTSIPIEISELNYIFRTEYKRALLSHGNNSAIIYVCSGLRNGINHQMNDDIFDELKTEFSGLIYEKGDSNLFQSLNYYKDGREVLAIVDLVFLELYSNQFIGVSHSTFSGTANLRIAENRRNIMLNFFNWK